MPNLPLKNWLNRNGFVYNNDQAKIDQAYSLYVTRLTEKISEFEDLASIENWKSIQDDKAITERLQLAWGIMHETIRLKRHRCKPCEMEALCAIKEIVNSDK